MSPDDVNDISRSQLRCKTVYPENDVYGDVILAFPNTTLEAKHAGRGAPSEPLRRRQGLTEYSSRPRL